MKKNNPIKNVISYIPVITIAIGLIAGWVKISMSSDDAKTKISELKADVKEIANEGDKKIDELTEKNKDLEKKVEVNKAQQDNIQREVQQINNKTDKIVELLIDIKKKK